MEPRTNVTVWCLHGENNDIDSEDLLKEHDYGSVDTLVHEYHFGENDISVEIEGNRWIDLWKSAEKAIIESGDLHHVYIEDFKKGEDGVLHLIAGS